MEYFGLIITVVLTILISSICSMFEANVLGTTPIEIESLKKISKNRGVLLENLINNIDKTTSSILTSNTIANTFGATLAGSMCSEIIEDEFVAMYVFPAIMTISILFFSEILPKNIGIIYRKNLQKYIVYPLYWLCIAMAPISKSASWIITKVLPKRKNHTTSSDEIILLAQKSQKDGSLSLQERDLITNSLSLDDITIAEIMTPRTVVYGLEASLTAEEAFKMQGGLKFSRIPVYNDSIDNIIGIVRRREILTAIAENRGSVTLEKIATPAMYIPENGSALAVLKQFIKRHQQVGIVVDEFSSLTGVVSLEDIFEHLLGSEIFDNDDMAVDMRELARKKRNSKK